MESFVERLDAAAERLERHATENIGVFEQSSRMNDQCRTVGGHELRAVDQSEAFFRPQDGRRDTGARKRFVRRFDAAIDANGALSDHRQDHVR